MKQRSAERLCSSYTVKGEGGGGGGRERSASGGARVDRPGSRRAGGSTGIGSNVGARAGRRSGKPTPRPPGERELGSKFESSSERRLSGEVGGSRSRGWIAGVRNDRPRVARDGPRSGVETGKDSRSRRTLLHPHRTGRDPLASRSGRDARIDEIPNEASRLSARGSSLTVVDAEYLQPPGLSGSPRGRVSSPRREDHGGEARAPSRRTSSAVQPRSPPVPSRQGSARGSRGARDAAPRARRRRRGRRHRRRRRRGRARGPPFARVPRAARSALHGRGRRRRKISSSRASLLPARRIAVQKNTTRARRANRIRGKTRAQ